MVISIIALLVALLLPALKEARETARIVVCSTNQRNLFLAMSIYGGDHKGWLMPVYHNRENSFSQPRTNGQPGWWQFGNWYDQWIPNKKMLVCPSRDRVFNDKGYGTTWRTSWFLIAGTGDYSTTDAGANNRYFFGRRLAVVSDTVTGAPIDFSPFKEDSMSFAPVPNANWPGQWVTGYGVPSGTDAWGPIYIHPPGAHPAMVEAHHDRPDDWWWADNFWGSPDVLPPVHHERGGNVLFMDGHGGYRRTSASQPRFQTNVIFQPAYW